ncbi:MAG: hypothetical protein M3Y07_16345, partial [Acidobacteriota bacterium]|nr:hypothetical protein [Acidobacteriota bacterium]
RLNHGTSSGVLTLRLECRERKLELRPSPDGVTAFFLDNNLESKSEPVDLDGSPEDLVQRWLASRQP